MSTHQNFKPIGPDPRIFSRKKLDPWIGLGLTRPDEMSPFYTVLVQFQCIRPIESVKFAMSVFGRSVLLIQAASID